MGYEKTHKNLRGEILGREALFYSDNPEVFEADSLRSFTRGKIENLTLLQRCREGDPEAVNALFVGFWPFVNEFEKAIDRRKMPRQPLQKKFGSEIVVTKLRALKAAVDEMQHEEQSHAAHWLKDAAQFGIPTTSDNIPGEIVPGVRALTESVNTRDMSEFFAILAGTEFVAEELADFLQPSKAFTDLSKRKRWIWGEIHRIPHVLGPSHLEIDLDLARAYLPHNNTDVAKAQESVLNTINLFENAARNVEQTMASRHAIATE